MLMVGFVPLKEERSGGVEWIGGLGRQCCNLRILNCISCTLQQDTYLLRCWVKNHDKGTIHLNRIHSSSNRVLLFEMSPHTLFLLLQYKDQLSIG